MTQKHTQGPWNLMYPDNPFDGFVAGPDDKLVAVGMGDDTRANARLIAAAPEILDALEQIVSLFPYFPAGSDERKALELAQEAIAKATGQDVQEPAR